jgi:ankyrin repeat protein
VVNETWRAAGRTGDVESIERLLSAGFDIDAKDEHGQTALMVASRNGHSAAAQLLIDHGANLNHRAKFNLTALMLAVVNGRVAIVRALVDAGADLAVRGTGAPGFHDKTALDLAVARSDEAVAERLSEIARILRSASGPQVRQG